MKKILIAIAALAVSAASMAQQPKSESQTKKMNDKAMLDGKVFVVSLSENTTATSGKTGNMVNDQPSGMDQGADPGKKSTVPDDKMTLKKMIIRFENGMVRTSGKSDLRVSDCAYKSWGMESTGISFSADCGTATGSMNSKPVNPAGTTYDNGTGTVSTETRTQDATVQKDAVTGTSTATQSGTTTTSQRTVTTSQTGTVTSNNIQLTGTVNGDSIHGTLTCTRPDGTIMTYSYTGTTAGKNDLDMEGEMGMK